MLVALSAIVAALCALASGRRLWLASNPTFFHPDEVVKMLGKTPGERAIARLRDAIAREPRAEWERDLVAALDAPEPARAALVNEQLTELDWRVQRWAGVPRVAARIATSFGFLLGALVLRDALSETEEVTEMVMHGVIGRAIGVVGMGIVGTLFCVGAHAQARRVAKERLAAADAMIERLEASARLDAARS